MWMVRKEWLNYLKPKKKCILTFEAEGKTIPGPNMERFSPEAKTPYFILNMVTQPLGSVRQPPDGPPVSLCPRGVRVIVRNERQLPLRHPHEKNTFPFFMIPHHLHSNQNYLIYYVNEYHLVELVIQGSTACKWVIQTFPRV